MRTTIEQLLRERILILDGAMGTAIQKHGLSESDYRGTEFIKHPVNLKGNNEMLNLTCPEVITSVHEEYISAGADIIETNTFSANAVSQEEYQMAHLAYRLAFEGARLAKSAAKASERQVFVAGSIGPTSKTLSLSPDVQRPEYRAVSFDLLSKAYENQVRGLLDGDVDLLLVETVFDALNAKSALYAISKIQEERGTNVPVMLSATLNDKSGRLLTGQSLEALYHAVSHYPLLSFGLNCSFGATDLFPFMQQLSKTVSCYLSLYPNAGLPNEMGGYDETPNITARYMKAIADKQLLNIAGGCCGTTPAHIKAIREILTGVPARPLPAKNKTKKYLVVSGLEPLTLDKEQRNFLNVGERTNVAGSAKFARLIREKKYEDALSIAREQVENGAAVIDINMDDAMLNSSEEMETFIRYLNNDADVAKVPLMIDSSHWQTLLVGLKNAQGKSIVNSISLKEGEIAFIEKAKEIHRLGAAVIVMAFDEKGQADTYERKIEICKRAYDLLTGKAGYLPHDIIFDVNVLAIGTGMEEHRTYALNFIRAVSWIKQHLPDCLTSGGISNLSFAFRGNNTVREAMHSVFLFHAIKAGLDMGIVNPALLQVYDDIAPKLLETVENVVLNKTEDATEKLLSLSETLRGDSTSTIHEKHEEWRAGTLEERLTYALLKGIGDYLAADLEEALATYSTPVDIIEQPLMKGMDKVGTLFGEGKMFLPQVIKSAKIMKTAVSILQPAIEKNNPSSRQTRNPKVVLATVKGDVHDIGKNIVSIVLSCNNIDVIDLGVMVDNRTIIDEAVKHQADMIGVSGLITPSLGEMEDLCTLLYNERRHIPLAVGGATTSAIHTAVKLAPKFGTGVLHARDASRAAVAIKQLLQNPAESMATIENEQKKLRENYLQKSVPLLSLAEARSKAPQFSPESYLQPEDFGEHNLSVKNLNINDLLPIINWSPFFAFWGFKEKYPDLLYTNEEADKLFNTALAELSSMSIHRDIDISAVVRFFNAQSEGDTIILDGQHRFPMLRQQLQGMPCLCLSDYVVPSRTGKFSTVGLFVFSVHDLLLSKDKHDMRTLLRGSLCARLAETFAGWLQEKISEGLHLIRPAMGYSACPDHSLKRDICNLLDAENKIGVTLTESCAMIPDTSICGMFIAHPEATYFNINTIGKDQFTDYCQRRNLSESEGRKWIGNKIRE
ncbi:MAG: methionine synthase [Bacteroidales bacterium]|nr:methionine synthase [Bacteroidales bacterium]